MTFLAGLVIGVTFGMIVIGFLAIGAYNRGYDAALSAPWRLELRHRARTSRRVPAAA